MDFGAVADGLTDNSSALGRAQASLNGHGGEIFFPEGKYYFKNGIVLNDSMMLSGEGAEKSVLIFDLADTTESAIRISGSEEKYFVSLKGGYKKDSRMILSDSSFYFRSGDWVEIREQNGAWNTVPIAWAKNSVGQIDRIDSIDGDILYLQHPLRIDYSDSLHPQIQRIYPVQNAGLECLKIKRFNKSGAGAGYNVYFNLAANSIILGIESDSSIASHVYVNRSTQIRVQQSYFHHAFVYDGSNTQGYGVTLAHHSGECLITNNIFVHLRHAMMLKTGANGNVISYNYSVDPFRTESIPDAAGDISLHGHFPFSNLIEGNIVQNIVIDHYWGPSGPWNTFFRNRAELYGIIMTDSDTTETNSQNFVGNETTNNEFFHGLFALSGSNHFSYGNHILQAIIPTGTSNLSDSSYYLSQAPAFWPVDSVWPSVGLPGGLGKGTIPAKTRYLSGSNFTGCTDTMHVSVDNVTANSPLLRIVPNPASSQFEIQFSGKPYGRFSYSLFNLQGKKMLAGSRVFSQQKVLVKIEPGVPKGIYILDVRLGNNHIVKKMAIQ